ncbi:MAG: hypothetical protein V8R16_02235 [Bacilli bacterium]
MNLDKKDLDILKNISEEKFLVLFPNCKLSSVTNSISEYYLKAKIFFMNFESNVTFYFKNNILIQIVITPLNIVSETYDINLKKSFNIYQKAINKIFGFSIIGLFTKDRKWLYKNVIIEHYIFERFYFEERIEIKFKSK